MPLETKYPPLKVQASGVTIPNVLQLEMLNSTVATGDDPNEAQVTPPGTQGKNSFTVTTAGYTQPAVGANVTVAVSDSEFAVVNQRLFVSDSGGNGGSYIVISKPTGTSIELQNDGATGNSPPATSVLTGAAVGPGGQQGENARTTTTANYTQPDVGLNVTVSVVNSNPFVVGQTVRCVDAGSDGGSYLVISIPTATSIELQNDGATGNSGVGQIVDSGASMVPSAKDGTTGQNAFTTTTANYTQPNIGLNVTVSVVNSDWIIVGQTIGVADGTGDGGSYLVVSIPNSTSVELQNDGTPTNSASGTTVDSGASMAHIGLAGMDGVDGGTFKFRGTWALATVYQGGDGTPPDTDLVVNSQTVYIAKSTHTSAADTEPGVGVNWTNVWDVFPFDLSALFVQFVDKTASFTIASTDHSKHIHCDTSSATVNCTIAAGLTTGFEFLVHNDNGTNNVVLVEDTGVTIRSKGNLKNIADQDGAATCVHKGSNLWFCYGDLS